MRFILIMASVVFVFIMPIGFANIGWRMYFVNASWDIVIIGLIVSAPFESRAGSH